MHITAVIFGWLLRCSFMTMTIIMTYFFSAVSVCLLLCCCDYYGDKKSSVVTIPFYDRESLTADG
jgi:hypothetical protein